VTRTYDRDRPVNLQANAFVVAAHRAEHFEGLDHNRFMDTFRVARVAGQTGREEDLYQAFRHALDADDSVTVAGIIEGLASTRGPEGKVW
jgi:hypothetical protein